MKPTKINSGNQLHSMPTLADLGRFIGKLKEVDPPEETRDLVTGKCWVFDGYKDAAGYAQFKFRGRAVWSHRFSKQFFHGVNLIGSESDHICRRRDCCNPSHAKDSSALDNRSDGGKRSRRKAVA